MHDSRTHGFETVHVESLRLHYARTLETWSANLAAKEAEAVRITNAQTYAMYQQYLTGCARYFRSGEINIHQFKMRCV